MNNNTAEQVIKSMEELSTMFNSRMTEFEKSLQNPSTSSGNPTIKSLVAEFSGFKTFVWNTFSTLKKQVELLAGSVDRIEMHSRRKVLLFHGMAEGEGEDLMVKLQGVLRDKLQLPIMAADSIEVCHRLGAKKDKARPVLVRFTSVGHRSLVWNKKTSLKGSNISLSEFLTKPRQEVFAAARKHFSMKQCWSTDGAIVILLPDSTRKKIVSMPELKQLIALHPPKPQVSNKS